MNTTSQPDPIRLEIFKNLYQFIAEQMGIVLQNTATVGFAKIRNPVSPKLPGFWHLKYLKPTQYYLWNE